MQIRLLLVLAITAENTEKSSVHIEFNKDMTNESAVRLWKLDI